MPPRKNQSKAEKAEALGSREREALEALELIKNEQESMANQSEPQQQEQAIQTFEGDDIPAVPAPSDAYDHLDSETDTPPARQDDYKADLKDIVEIIFPNNNIDTKSVLNQQQILAVAQARVVAATFDDIVLKRLTDALVILQMSYGGWARKDMRSILTYVLAGVTNAQAEEGRISTLKKRLFGGNADH